MPAGPRVLLALLGYLFGATVASLLGAAVVSAGGWELSVPATVGSEAGRAVRQIGQSAPLDDFRVPASVLALINVPLWAGLLGAPLLARRWGLDWRRDLGWEFRRVDVPAGLALGAATQFALVPVYELLFTLFGRRDVSAPARSLAAAVDSPVDLAGLLLMTVVAAPLTEEVVYRGLLFGAWRENANRRRGVVALAAVGSSLFFAASHFQVVQFPGLFIFGLVAAAVMQRTGRLGTAIWTHVGFNMTTVVMLLN